MKKIKLFLAATEQALTEDRMAVADLINHLNDKYEGKGIYFQLLKARGMPDLEAFTDCEMVFVIWFHQSDEIMDASFEMALEQFKKNGKPKIVTYFRQVGEAESADSVSIADNVSEFMQRLDHELGHYYNLYWHIDTLKFSLLMQIGVLERNVDLVCKGGQVLIGGDKYMSIYDVPCGAENKSLKTLQQEFIQCTARFYELRELRADNEGDQQIAAEFMAVADRRNELRERINQIEANIFNAAMSMADNIASGSLSQRQKEAYRLFERGDYEGANEILSFDEIKSDIQVAEQSADVILNKLQIYVNELLQKVDILRAVDTLWSDDHQAVLQTLREAARVEELHNLPKRAMLLLVEWLLEHHDISEALTIGNRLFLHMQLEQDPDMLRIRMLRYKLAKACYLINRPSEALDHLVAIEEQYVQDQTGQLLADDNEKNLHILTGTLMGNIYLLLPEKEEQLYTIVEDIEAYYLSDAFASDFDITYAEAFHEFVKLQVEAYRKIGRLDRARTFIEYEKKILEHIEPEIVQENVSEHARWVLEIYLLLSELHFEAGNYSQANEIEETLWREKMDFILEDSSRFADLSLKAYTLRARYCSMARNFTGAEYYLDDAVDFAKFLYTKSPDAYLADYAATVIALIESRQRLGYQLEITELEQVSELIDKLLAQSAVSNNMTDFIHSTLLTVQILHARQTNILTPQNAEQYIKESTLIDKYWDRVFVEMANNAVSDLTFMLFILDQIMRFYIYEMQRDGSAIEAAGQMISQAKAAIDQCLLYPEQTRGDFGGLLKRYRPTYYIAASLFYRRSNEPALAKAMAIEGLSLVQVGSDGNIERELVHDYAMLLAQLAEAEFLLDDTEAAISGYAAAITALTAINDATFWQNWSDIHTLMNCYHEYIILAISNDNYELAANHLDTAFDAISRVLFAESPDRREDAFCLMAWDYAKLVTQLTGIVKLEYAISFINDAVDKLEELLDENTCLTALHKSIIFLKLQRAYIISLDDDLHDVPEDLTDINAICGQHMEFVLLTNQDIEEWWSFYNQEFSLPELV